MEMNRYLLAALYVMAGCVVGVPLKAQGTALTAERGGYRWVMSDTVKVIPISIDVKKSDHSSCDFICEYQDFREVVTGSKKITSSKEILSEKNTDFQISNPIRAPEQMRN